MSSVFRGSLLSGRSAFLTGGSSGIGLRIAERFAQHGANVFLVGRRQEKLDEARATIEAGGGRVAAAALDVRDYEATASALARARAEFGPIDIVVAGAAGNFPAPALAMSANGFRAVIDIDLLGTFNTLRAAYEHLRRPGASVIAISAAHATVPIPFQAHVCAAKAGIELLLKTLAIEWGGDGVRLNCISPGPIADTEGMRRLAPSKEIRDQLTASIPLRRFGTKDEIADLALFLCSDAATYITGATFACDGGHSLTSPHGGMQSAWEAATRK